MRILLLTHSFNSLSQRLFGVLQALGHTVSVELDIADAVTEEAMAMFQPDVVLAPFLKRRIPETVWAPTVCLVVHPGIPGDRGPKNVPMMPLADLVALSGSHSNHSSRKSAALIVMSL